MIETECSRCGLRILITSTGREFDSGEFIERCRNFELKIERRFESKKPFQQQMDECPDLNAAVAKAT